MYRQRGMDAVEGHARAERRGAASVIRRRPYDRSRGLERCKKCVRVVEPEVDAAGFCLKVRVVSADDRVDRRLLGWIQNEDVTDRCGQGTARTPRNACDNRRGRGGAETVRQARGES